MTLDKRFNDEDIGINTTTRPDRDERVSSLESFICKKKSYRKGLGF